MSKWCGDENCLQCADKEPDPYVHLPRADYDALREQNRVLREALKPFAERWEYFERVPPVNGKEWDYYHCYADEEPSFVYLGQLKAAKAALTATSQSGGTHEL